MSTEHESQEQPPDEVDRLAALTAQFKQHVDKVMRCGRKTAEEMVAVGNILLKIKDIVRHGQFQQWIRDNTDIPYPTAAKWMRLAKKPNAAEQILDEFLGKKPVPDMGEKVSQDTFADAEPQEEPETVQPESPSSPPAPPPMPEPESAPEPEPATANREAELLFQIQQLKDEVEAQRKDIEKKDLHIQMLEDYVDVKEERIQKLTRKVHILKAINEDLRDIISSFAETVSKQRTVIDSLANMRIPKKDARTLVMALGMLGSDGDGEVLNAGRKANEIVRKYGTWQDLLAPLLFQGAPQVYSVAA